MHGFIRVVIGAASLAAAGVCFNTLRESYHTWNRSHILSFIAIFVVLAGVGIFCLTRSKKV